jgi:glucose-1-phosphate thymidylyltransferase
MLPCYDKPMIYYPLSVLMLAEIQDVLIISTPRDIPLFKELLGDGQWLGMRFEYAVQDKPRGLADAFIIGERFIGQDTVCLTLGDNIFFGRGFSLVLKNAVHKVESEQNGVVFGYYVKNPSSYGVVEFSSNWKVLSIEEKPERPKSHYAVPGLYFYDNDVVGIAKNIAPSARGEIEITAVNNTYLAADKLSVELLGRGMAWLDTGTYDGLLDASNFIATIQKREGMFISCVEEIAYLNQWITQDNLLTLASSYKTEYGDYLRQVAEGF